MTAPESALTGVFVKAADPLIATVLAGAGMDFLVIDLEHSSLSIKDVERICAAVRPSGTSVYARISAADLGHAGRLLDSGAHGIQLSGVETPEVITELIEATHFPPAGKRGLSLATAAADYGARTAASLLAQPPRLVLQIESKAGIDRLPELLKMVTPECWFLGLTDLSADCGTPGELNAPEVTELAERAAALIVNAGQRLGVFAPSLEQARHWQQRGAGFVAVGSDSSLLREAAALRVQALSAPGLPAGSAALTSPDAPSDTPPGAPSVSPAGQ